MRFLIALVEQGLGALITFGVNLWLIRAGRTESYGVYVFWYGIAWVLGTCQNTLTIVHLSSLPAGTDRLAERRAPERVLFSASLVILFLALLGVGFANAILGAGLRQPAAELFIPAFLAFQFVRAFAFSRQRPAWAACLTGAVMVCAGSGLAADAWAGFPPDASRVLLIVGAAYGVCSVTVLGLLAPELRPVFRLSVLVAYGKYLRGSGWLMLGAGSSEVIGRLYGFLVVGFFGPAALAGLSAVQVVIRPAWMISAAWVSIGFPALATRRAAGDFRGFFGLMGRGAGLAAAGGALWSFAAMLAWPWISTLLYRGKYPDIGDLGWLWGGNVVLGGVAVALNTAMLVLGKFRALALIDLLGASACAGATVLLLENFGAPASIVGIMLGQAAQIALMAWALRGG